MTAVKQQTETAAQVYERLADAQFEAFLDESFSEDSLKDVPLYEVKVPSGMKFKCRAVGREFFTQAGVLPLSLMEYGIAGAASDEEVESTFASMPAAAQRQAIKVTSQMIRYACVEPRLILGTVNGHRNAISVDMVRIPDYKHLADWAKAQTEGGKAAPGLRTFRKRRK